MTAEQVWMSVLGREEKRWSSETEVEADSDFSILSLFFNLCRSCGVLISGSEFLSFPLLPTLPKLC